MLVVGLIVAVAFVLKRYGVVGPDTLTQLRLRAARALAGKQGTEIEKMVSRQQELLAQPRAGGVARLFCE